MKRASLSANTETGELSLQLKYDCGNFIVAKTYDGATGDERRYRNQFFYSVKDLFVTGIEKYSDLGECVLTLLRLQADHESERQNSFPVDKDT